MGMLLHRHRAEKEPVKKEEQPSVFEQEDTKEEEPARKPGRPKKNV
jgi:hypothetical protein